MSRRTVRIGGAAAAWGDTIHGARQLVEKGNVDYLVGDYLAEVTMALLARARAKSPEAGFIPDWLVSVKPVLQPIRERGIRLVTNSGGMNPHAARDAFLAAAGEQDLDFKVAVVLGDDLMPDMEALRRAAPLEMFSGAALPARFASLNAYLGAGAIARALDEGADVVITGRVVDSAMALGPLMHEFGWRADDYDRLAAGSLAGHVIECGAQATGGLFTDWEAVADGWPDMGFPIVECVEDGSFTVTKPAGTGGLVSIGTVAEQIVYEIGDPQSYHLPDVICDFSEVHLEQDGPDRVRVSGAKGRAPGPDFKVCGTHLDGYRIMTTYMIAGWQAGAKGRRSAEALVERTARMLAGQGMAPYDEISIEVIGAEDTYGAAARVKEAREVVVKLGLRHRQAEALDVFAREFAHPGVAMAQGLTGVLHGRPKPAPVLRVHSFLWPKSQVQVVVEMDGVPRAVVAVPIDGRSQPPPPPVAPPAIDLEGPTVSLPLRTLAWGRSGDKGNHANIGIIAREPEYYALLVQQVTAERIADFFAHYLEGEVRRFLLPGFHALNFLLHDVLGGGGTASLRYDPQAKTYAQMVLDLPVDVPVSWAGSNEAGRSDDP
ncbi:acyclic terpene utilization AtuA family protein [Chelativorans sp. ZYF759]|uniref:acyclic terpene utilization AtuA family protein n=1 Tax=Chelativorans sp. ZYF759 TaxID=2692213 RepID=UPI00145C61BC|nr:acyclic terpene utilization AtuA family protein [Chelativorans sp. ZYF759]NMG40827.1 acyclic terpene utilization AtuA family protein [Chelativorans sp. ZYF759]